MARANAQERGHALSCAHGGVSGWRFCDLPPELPAQQLEEWLVQGHVRGSHAIKDNVQHHGTWVFKFSGPKANLRARMRPSPAVRAARTAMHIAPVRTATAFAALEWRGTARSLRNSLLVCEYLDGLHLHQLWDQHPQAVRAFPHFVADMHARGVHHGDFHPQNSIWTGQEWALIDLEGVRSGLQGLQGERLARTQWARMYHNMVVFDSVYKHRMRPLYDTYADIRGLYPEPGAQGEAGREREWKRIVALADTFPS